MTARALFLDRDGTLMVDTGYVRDPNEVVLLPGVPEALLFAKQRDYQLIQVSNQSGVARGLISEAQLSAVQRRFESLLAAKGAALDLVVFCKHGPDEDCPCRKPRPGMLLDAAESRNIDLSRSIMIGDSPRDVAAGHAAGCTTILVGSCTSEPPPDHSIDSFLELPRLLGGR